MSSAHSSWVPPSYEARGGVEISDRVSDAKTLISPGSRCLPSYRALDPKLTRARGHLIRWHRPHVDFNLRTPPAITEAVAHVEANTPVKDTYGLSIKCRVGRR